MQPQAYTLTLTRRANFRQTDDSAPASGMVRLWGICQFTGAGGAQVCYKSASFGLASEGVRRFCGLHKDASQVLGSLPALSAARDLLPVCAQGVKPDFRFLTRAVLMGSTLPPFPTRPARLPQGRAVEAATA